MKKMILIVAIIAGLSCCLQSTSFAKVSKDFEKILIQGNKDSAEEALRIMYRNNKIDSYELNGLLDFISIGVLQSISSFETLSDKYIITKNNKTFTESEREYSKITQALSERDRIISQGIKYLSNDFIEEFNLKVESANKKMSVITSIYNDEIEKQKEAKLKNDIEEEVRKEKLARRAELEMQRQEEAENAYREAVEFAENNLEYKKNEITCEICQSVASKKEYEGAINKEKQYSSKYGVVNLSRIEELKVGIIRCDNVINENRSEYKKITNIKFNFSDCGNANLSCRESLDNIKNSLIEKYLSERQAESSKQID